jgi:hypothetical protein
MFDSLLEAKFLFLKKNRNGGISLAGRSRIAGGSEPKRPERQRTKQAFLSLTRWDSASPASPPAPRPLAGA